ncbi:MAG: hypothetical protein ACJ8IK_16145 [Burkholderiaceae bacterium]
MLRVATESERIAAVLHGVVEDSDVSLEALAAEGFADDVVCAVEGARSRASAASTPADGGLDRQTGLDGRRIERPARDHCVAWP